MAFLSIFFLIIGVIALTWLIIHVEKGMRYSRKKAFISASVAAIMFGFGLHFLMMIFGT
ncbi:MAG: hypothetical protein EAX96_19190 [Candidatus Lokiarchaeota archaeon]|nr:hypothetical protein [Candidatus Lokiarchaeota archaeon]